MNESPYDILKPASPRLPLLISVPHCGIEFPSEIVGQFLPEQLASLDDTDWFVNKLYDFAVEMGATLISAKYSRWVIDLNRKPGSIPLYSDGRIITALCPTTDFLGNPIYKEPRNEPNDEEISRRLDAYFYPYHHAIDELINDLRKQFQRVVFWDAHSIRRNVKTIREEPFPDLILGTNDGKSAEHDLTRMVIEKLEESGFSLNYNTPFKGGYITRSKGAPDKGVSAFQLEMSKDLYMNDAETEYDPKRASNIRSTLRDTLESLCNSL